MNRQWTDLKHPIGIVSKGRSDSMYTARSLRRMKIPHYIVIEPQDEQAYNEALEKFDLKDYVTLIVAPFSNHGDGPGRARNFFWDWCIDNHNTGSHWILDDNIQDFYRLHKNQRIRVESGILFRSCEEFIDRFENVPVSGLQYRFFIAPNSYRPPYVTNTRIYSTLLINNDCKFKWRGRYNEDTDLSLRILKAGECTIQFNHFLQGKCATQTVGGGNTSEFYHAEFLSEEDKQELKRKRYHEKGTINKSQMLVDMHPDVCEMVWRYGRWHHHCNYDPFKKNKLKYKDGKNAKDFEYQNELWKNLMLIDDYSEEKYPV